MSEQKNIDRLFREKFKHFEATPDARLWSAIEKRMGYSRRGRRMLPFFIRYGSIAAAIALLITLGYNLNPENNSEVPQSITTIDNADTRENTNDNNDNTSVVSTDNIPESQDNVANTVNTGTDNNNIIPVGQKRVPNTGTPDNNPGNREAIAMNDPKTGKTQQSGIVENDNAVRNMPLPEERDNAVAENKQSLFDAIAEKKTVEEEVAVAQNTSDKWSIRPNAAPIYFNSLGDGSPISDEFSDNSKSGNITLSYGVNVAYQVNDRFSVRSGINRVNYGYNTNNIQYTAGRDITGDITVKVSDANTVDNVITSSPIVVDKPEVRDGKIVQEFGYLEVPLEVKYRLVNKKVGVNLIGGVSSLFLTDNMASVRNESFNTQIDQPENLNNFNLSTNIGLGIDYNISNEILFNVEPMFKYQLNTFSNDSGGFRPYSLGVYTGLSFRF